MAGQISTIKKRLQSVNSTKKLTNATELVATVNNMASRRCGAIIVIERRIGMFLHTCGEETAR